MFQHPDFIQLLHSAQNGEKEAQERLLSTLRPYLEDLARGYADPDHAAESTADLVQEAWVRAWQKLDEFEGGSVEEEAQIRFRAWVGQIVHRLGLNSQRDRLAHKRHPRGRAIHRLQAAESGESGQAEGGKAGRALDPQASQTSPSQKAQRSEEAERVRKALESVPDPQQRDILRLRFFQELPLTEAAERLGITYERARSLFSKALKELEARLGEPEPPAQ